MAGWSRSHPLQHWVLGRKAEFSSGKDKIRPFATESEKHVLHYVEMCIAFILLQSSATNNTIRSLHSAQVEKNFVTMAVIF